jgi:TPR repeat protein
MTRKIIQYASILIGAVILVAPGKAEIVQSPKDRKVTETGNAATQLQLGLDYQNGNGVPQDDAKAAVWFRKAACQGNVDAQLKLSEAYYQGRGVPRDYMLAGWWMLKVASKRTAVAEAKLKERAAKAALGDAEAQNELRNANAKFLMLIEMAEQGDAAAQNQLGLAFGLGDGVSRDDIKSAAWHRRAAEQGNPLSQSLLAMAYAEGAGVAKDHVEALKWFNILLAQTKGPDRLLIAMVISFTARKMTREQILEAQLLARQWKGTKVKP